MAVALPTSSTYTTFSASSDDLVYSKKGSARFRITSKPYCASSASANTTSDSSDNDLYGAGTPASTALGRSARRKPHRLTTNMTSLSGGSGTSSSASSGRAKLHKRQPSGSSVPTSPTSFAGRPTPYATYEDQPFPEPLPTHPMSSTDKLKPYFRKISNPKEKEADQGQIDLSMSTAENERLAGLGIQDFGAHPQSPLELSFSRNARRSHNRTTSEVSNSSNSFRPTQPFVHPMRQTPRPYTTPAGSSQNSFTTFPDPNDTNPANSINPDDEISSPSSSENENTSTTNPAHRTRNRRSTSHSSTAPSPLSHSQTLEEIPKLTTLPARTSTSTHPSTTDLSLRAATKTKSRSTSTNTLPCSSAAGHRTSLDKARGLLVLHGGGGGRRRRSSDVTAGGGGGRKCSSSEVVVVLSREERIAAARREFAAKEAGKERKAEWRKREKKLRKGRERQEEKEEKGVTRYDGGDDDTAVFPAFTPGEDVNSSLQSTNYANTTSGAGPTSHEDYEEAALPRYQQNSSGDGSETVGEGGCKDASPSPSGKKRAQSNWLRFETWVRMRVVGCGKGKG